MLEKRIVANVMAAARKLGWWTYKTHGSQFGVAGIPDILAIKDGKAAWMEAKRPGQKPTRIQERRMQELSGFGCPVAVVTSASEAVEFLCGVSQ